MRQVAGLRLLCLASILLACGLPAIAFGQTFGSIELKPGESRQVSIGPTFRDLRVCNDLKSAGPVVVKIGSSWDRTLRPGQCAQDRGNMIGFRNLVNAKARITYRAMAEPSTRWYQ